MEIKAPSEDRASDTILKPPGEERATSGVCVSYRNQERVQRLSRDQTEVDRHCLTTCKRHFSFLARIWSTVFMAVVDKWWNIFPAVIIKTKQWNRNHQDNNNQIQARVSFHPQPWKESLGLLLPPNPKRSLLGKLVEWILKFLRISESEF